MTTGEGKHLFIVNDFPPIIGGQSSYLYFLCRALAPNKIMVMAPACGDTGAFDRTQEFTIIRKPYLFQVPLLEKLAKIILPLVWIQPILKREKVVFLHCAHVLSTGFIGLAMKTFRGMDYALYIHSADVMEHQTNPLLRPWLDRILSGAQYVICNSHFTRDLGIISYGFNPMITDDGEHTGVHGNDERVPEAAFRRGVSDFYAVIRNVVFD